MKRMIMTIFLLAASVFAGEKPNVLFIMVDDLNSAVGFLGDKTAKTPNMDRLAREGIRFEYAHVNADLPAVPPVDDDRPAAESSRTRIN